VQQRRHGGQPLQTSQQLLTHGSLLSRGAVPVGVVDLGVMLTVSPRC
jgi:hypothetical protein